MGEVRLLDEIQCQEAEEMLGIGPENAHLPMGGLSVFLVKDFSIFFEAAAWSRKDLLPALLDETDLPARCLEKLSL